LRFYALIVGSLLLIIVGFTGPVSADDKPRDLVITAVGDIAFPAESFQRRIDRLNTKMFDPTRKILKRGDLVFGNLEAPLTDAPTIEEKTYAYTMPPERLEWLLDAGFNLFSLANNHTADAGERGVRDTLELMERTRKTHRIHWSGATSPPKKAYEPTIFTVRGTKIGFLAVGNNSSPLVYRMHPRRVVKALQKLDKKVDIIVLSVHYGKEYVHVPKKRTVRIYHDFVDAGADLILGHHPHVVRGVEQYKKGLILHSLGNFTFASKTVRHRAAGAKLYGLIAEVRISKKRIDRVILHPLYVNNLEKWTLGNETIPAANFVPYPVKGKFARAVLKAVQQWSDAIAGNRVKIRMQGDRGVVRLR
jgi:poly-gamma-glutamate synthesis protein (capsule biosynthesis protein)